MAERGRRHRRRERSVVDPVELKLEEQEIAGERGHPLVRVAIEFRPRRIAGVGGVEERSVGHDAAGEVLQRLVGLHRLAETFAAVLQAGDRPELSPPRLGELLGFPLGALEIGGEARRVHAFVKVLKSPLRQRAEIGRGGRGRLSGAHGIGKHRHCQRLVNPSVRLVETLAPTKRRFWGCGASPRDVINMAFTLMSDCGATRGEAEPQPQDHDGRPHPHCRRRPRPAPPAGGDDEAIRLRRRDAQNPERRRWGVCRRATGRRSPSSLSIW